MAARTHEESSSLLSVSRLWALDRYARFVASDGGPLTEADKVVKGKWQTYSRQDHPDLKLSLIESNHLMVTNGLQILESILLWQQVSQNWIKAVAKGDSILFLYRQDNHNRRFRIKLGAVPLPTPMTSVDVCREVVQIFNPLIAIEVISGEQSGPSGGRSQTSQEASSSSSSAVVDESNEKMKESNQYEGSRKGSGPSSGSGQDPLGGKSQDSSKMDETISINTVGQELLSPPHPPDHSPLPLGQAYVHTHFPTQQLSSFIRLCLSDPEFAAFVEAVEKEMSQL